MKESYLQKKIIEALKSRYADKVVVYNIHGSAYQEAGIPDLLICLCGQFIGFEIKVEGQYDTTEIQEYQIARINKAGGVAMVVTSIAEAVAICENILEKM